MEELEKMKAIENEKLLGVLAGQEVALIMKPQYWPVLPAGPGALPLLQGKLTRSLLAPSSSFWSVRVPQFEALFLASDVAMVLLPSAVALRAH